MLRRLIVLNTPIGTESRVLWQAVVHVQPAELAVDKDVVNGLHVLRSIKASEGNLRPIRQIVFEGAQSTAAAWAICALGCRRGPVPGWFARGPGEVHGLERYKGEECRSRNLAAESAMAVGDSERVCLRLETNGTTQTSAGPRHSQTPRRLMKDKKILLTCYPILDPSDKDLAVKLTLPTAKPNSVTLLQFDARIIVSLVAVLNAEDSLLGQTGC